MDEDYTSETNGEPDSRFDLVPFAAFLPGCNPEKGWHVEDQYERYDPEHFDADVYESFHGTSLHQSLRGKRICP